MKTGTVKPNRALKTLWAGLQDSEEARREYEAFGNTVRRILNEWAQLDPQRQEKALQTMKAQVQIMKAQAGA